jgi:hypothetical protein
MRFLTIKYPQRRTSFSKSITYSPVQFLPSTSNRAAINNPIARADPYTGEAQLRHKRIADLERWKARANAIIEDNIPPEWRRN